MNRLHWCAVLGLWALWLGACSTPPRTYDLVIANGRVMDPETGFDGVAHVGIVGNRIEAISDSPLRGNRSIDAGGLVVAPGLIELHTHAKTSVPVVSNGELQTGVTPGRAVRGPIKN